MPQLSDSPAREVPGFWLGDASSGWRWPVDARFTSWVLAGALVIPCFVVLAFVVPFGVLVVLTAVALGRSKYLGEYLYDLHGMIRNAYRDVVVYGLPLLALLVAGGAVLRPMHWLLALPAAPLAAIAITRTVAPHVDTVRPFGYWLALLGRVAAAPRPRRRPVTAVVAAPARAGDVVLSDTDLLALDAPEITVPKYRPRVTPVEALPWTPRDPMAAAALVAWLSRRGFGSVNTEGNWLAILRDGERQCFAKPGHVVVIDADGAVEAMPAKTFEKKYEAA